MDEQLLTPCSGNVGLSLGYPGVMSSFCGQFRTFSKVVLCLMMIRGRHRTLPYALDRAIMLPNDIQSPFSESSDQSTEDGTEKVTWSTQTDNKDRDEPAALTDSTSEKHSKGK